METKKNAITSHRDLDVWKNAMELTILIYRISTNYPKGELFGLVSQLRRASVSVAANIAEGFGRNIDNNKELIQFLYYSQGSLSEIETMIIVSRDVNYLSEQEFAEIQSMVIKIRMLLSRLIQSLKNKH